MTRVPMRLNTPSMIQNSVVSLIPMDVFQCAWEKSGRPDCFDDVNDDVSATISTKHIRNGGGYVTLYQQINQAFPCVLEKQGEVWIQVLCRLTLIINDDAIHNNDDTNLVLWPV